MRFTFSPNVMIILFVIAGRCFLIDATPDHSVPEQQEDRILQDTPFENDVESCSSSCDTSAMSDFVASLDIQVVEEEDSDGIFGGLLGRLMNGFFKIFKRRQEDGPSFTVRTEAIVPLLQESSTKFKALAEIIQQESVTDAALSTTPDAIRMLYNVSAENMLFVSKVLDPIVENMRLHTTMDARSINCDLMKILTLIRDVTIPNIKLTAKFLSTKLGDADTKDTIHQYIDTSKLATTTLFTGSTTGSSRQDGTCIHAPNPTMTSRISNPETILEDAGPIRNIVNIILLLILFPVSAILFLILFILTWAVAPIAYILVTNGVDPVEGPLASFLSEVYLSIALLPFITIVGIVLNVIYLVNTLYDLFTIDPDPTPAPTFSPTFSPYPVIFVGIPSEASEVKRRILVVLESPIKTIVKLVDNKKSLSDTTSEDEKQMDCELSALKCKTDSLNDILPF